MKIKVTRKLINKSIKKLGGKYCNDEYCPIALAIKEKTHKKVSVENSYAYIGKRWENKEYKLPNQAKKFIRDFDKDKKVKPFSFELKPICF